MAKTTGQVMRAIAAVGIGLGNTLFTSRSFGDVLEDGDYSPCEMLRPKGVNCTNANGVKVFWEDILRRKTIALEACRTNNPGSATGLGLSQVAQEDEPVDDPCAALERQVEMAQARVNQLDVYIRMCC